MNIINEHFRITSLTVMLRIKRWISDAPQGAKMQKIRPSEKEYEALATVRDILLILYEDIGESTGAELKNLLAAFEFVDGLVGKMMNGLNQ